MDRHSPANASDEPSVGRAQGLAPMRLDSTVRRRARSGALAPLESVIPAPLHHAALTRRMHRYRLHVGEMIVDLRHFARQASTDLRVAGTRALLLYSLTEAAEIVTESATLTCPARTPFLFTREATLSAIWRTGSWGLAIQLRRDRINAAASAACGDARRVMSVATLLEPGVDRTLDEGVARILALVAGANAQHGPTILAFEAAFHRALAARIEDHPDADSLVGTVRSVSEAMRLVRDDHGRPFDTESLAAIVGVTAQTLRKGFRSCLGMSVKEYIQSVRLEWARRTLSSTRDGRPIAEIAREAGFSESPPFSRAYMKRFGEPPSQTRARAVRAAPG